MKKAFHGQTEGYGKMIAALYVDPKGCYSSVPNIDLWDISRDARNYAGPYPVVAHPPCQLWGKFAHVNFARWGGEHNRLGNDGGCFAAALDAVRLYGGVLEHPAFSDAWKVYGLPRPVVGKWEFLSGHWVTEVWQSAYGHKARKRTWLLYCGKSEPSQMK